MTKIDNNGYPDLFVLRTGYSCNNKCIHCFVENIKNKASDISFDEIKSVIDNINSNKLYVITGGEPTIRSDLIDILKYIHNKGSETNLQTNGVKFGNIEYAKEIAPHLDSCTIPIHSSNESIFDATTQIKGSWEQTINGLKNLVKLNVRFTTQTVITSLNYKTLLETFDFIQKIKPGCGMTLTFICPDGAAYIANIFPLLKDVKPYIIIVLKKYAYLMHTHYIPKCILYPYHNLVYFIDKTDDGNTFKQGWEFTNNEWGEVNHGEMIDRVKLETCKDCIFNNECIGYLKKYNELQHESISSFNLSEDLIPIVSQNINRSLEEKIKIWKEYMAQKTEKDYLTMYIHVPYCSQRCLYCEYFSKISNNIDDSCIDYLEQQFKDAAPYFEKEKIKALNFGGGTPNLLSPKQLEKILKMIQKYWNLEIGPENEMGFEFNPYHMTEEHFKVLENSYINRLSMGVQSFDEKIIEKEKRLYTSPEQIFSIYNRTKHFSRMTNVDLLAGLIDQTSDTLIKDVETLMNIGVEIITVYEVNKVPLHKDFKENDLKYITMMLMDLYKKLGNDTRYRYVGTNPIDGFFHCNRFYKNGINGFSNFYNPAPQGFNNLIAFSIDEKNVKIHPYSHFICIDKAYEGTNNGVKFYSIKERNDRSFWLTAEEKRNEH